MSTPREQIKDLKAEVERLRSRLTAAENAIAWATGTIPVPPFGWFHEEMAAAEAAGRGRYWWRSPMRSIAATKGEK